jgi:hypothetical protein
VIVEPRLLEHRLGQKLEGRPFTRKSPVTLEARADPRGWSRCQSNVANCQETHRLRDYLFPKIIFGSPSSAWLAVKGDSEEQNENYRT